MNIHTTLYRALIQNENAVKKLGDNNLRNEDLIIPESMAQNFGCTVMLGKQVHSKLRNCFPRMTERSKNPSGLGIIESSFLRDLAKYVTEQLRKSTTVDWQVQGNVRAKLRHLVRRALRHWKYPPDKADEAIALCLKQAEVLSHSWSA